MIEKLGAILGILHGKLRQLLFQDGVVGHVASSLRLRRGHARFEACEDVQPVEFAIVDGVPRGVNGLQHGDGNIKVRSVAGANTVKALLHDTDHHHGEAIHGQGLVQNRRVARQFIAPIGVAQHYHGIRARGAIVLRREHSPDGGSYSQHLEKIAGDDFGGGLLRRTLPRQRDARSHTGDHAGESRVAIPQIAIHGVGKDGFVVVAGGVSRSVIRGVEHHQALRIVHRERAQRHLIEEGKDGGIGADPQGQGEHRDGAKEGIAPQRA